MIKIKIVKANFGLRIFIFPYNISMKHLNIHIDFFERNGEKILGTINRIINENERIALIGPNGAGKSTFMKIISGQITDFEGNIENIGNMTLGYLEQIHFADNQKKNSR